MTPLVTSFSRAALMGLAWAGVWTPIGMLAGTWMVGELEPEHIGGPLYVSVICGALFSGLAGLASGRRRLADMSPVQAAGWGAAGGLFVGVLLFAAGEGDVDRYQADWTFAVVATSAGVAAIAAALRRSAGLTPLRAAALAAVITGLLAAVLPVLLLSPDSRVWFLPLMVSGTFVLVGTVSAFLSALVAPSVTRWWKKQNSVASPSVT